MTSLKNWYKGTVPLAPQATLAVPLAPQPPLGAGMVFPSTSPLLPMAQPLGMEANENQGGVAPACGADGSWCWSITLTPPLTPQCSVGCVGLALLDGPQLSTAL